MVSWRYGVFSLLLLFAVALLALKNYAVWTHPVEVLLEEGRVKKGETKSEGTPAISGRKETGSIASYITISEKNIFNPDRKEFSITGTGFDQSKPMTRPQIVLYGITIASNYQAASVANPGRPLRKGEREMMTLKIGDKVGEYRLAKILPDRITMEAGEDVFDVLLYDANAPKRRAVVKTETRPAEVTSTAPGPAVPAPVPAPKTAPKAAEAPKPGEPPRERVMEAPLPRPVTPPSPSYPSTLRGRRPVRPYTPPESESK